MHLNESIDTMECATSISFFHCARRPFEGPLSENDICHTIGSSFERENSESGFEAGIEMAIRAILVSPEFLFRIEQDPADFASGTVYALNDVELASRLSFFLWSTIPDKELMNSSD